MTALLFISTLFTSTPEGFTALGQTCVVSECVGGFSVPAYMRASTYTTYAVRFLVSTTECSSYTRDGRGRALSLNASP